MSDGTTAVVTGGASGIGRGICREFGEAGVDVVVADLQEDPLGEGPPTTELFDDLDASAMYAETDVTDADSVASTFDAAVERFGNVDVLVNNAGVTRFASVTDAPEDDWQMELQVNLTGIFNCCKHGVPLLTENDSSAVVNLSSIFGLRGGVGNFGYTTAKGGVVAATMQLATEYGRQGMRANAVAPGFIDSRMLHNDAPDGTQEFGVQRTPQNRLGDLSEVASVVRFLASEDASYVNGQVIAVDGGFTSA